MEQIVKRKEKPVVKIFIVFILAVILVNFIIYLANYLDNKNPYISTLISIISIVIICSWILIKYFSDYSYELSNDYLIFSRLIGKRKFEMLYINLDELVWIREKDQAKIDKKPLYDFSLDEEKKYIGKYRKNNKEHYFIFAPSQELLGLIRKAL